MAKLFGFLFLLTLDVPAVMLRGFVLSTLWLWFLVPLGVPAIGVAAAVGVALLIGLITHQHVVDPLDSTKMNWFEKGVARLITSTLSSLLAWGVGAIVVQYV